MTALTSRLPALGLISAGIALLAGAIAAQSSNDARAPQTPPAFWKSRIDDVEKAVATASKPLGRVGLIGGGLAPLPLRPGWRPVSVYAHE